MLRKITSGLEEYFFGAKTAYTICRGISHSKQKYKGKIC